MSVLILFTEQRAILVPSKDYELKLYHWCLLKNVNSI